MGETRSIVPVHRNRNRNSTTRSSGTIPKNPVDSVSVSVTLGSAIPAVGYTGGGTQVGEASVRWSSSRCAVGRDELSSLQHN